jgi:hypothetical protein
MSFVIEILTHVFEGTNASGVNERRLIINRFPLTPPLVLPELFENRVNEMRQFIKLLDEKKVKELQFTFLPQLPSEFK